MNQPESKPGFAQFKAHHPVAAPLSSPAPSTTGVTPYEISPEEAMDDLAAGNMVLSTGDAGKGQWSLSGNRSYLPVNATVGTLPSGAYIIKPTNSGLMFCQVDLHVDQLLRFPESASDLVLNEIEEFWKNKEKYKLHGFLHRRGYLFFGPQGSGKTSVVQQICKGVIDNKGLVIICEHPNITEVGLRVVRNIESQRPIVCLFEDIDALITTYGEPTVLSVLDGESQVDCVLNIATTNYPEKLDPRVRNRPRRFDRRIRIGMPSSASRRLYFKEKLKVDEQDLDRWVKASEEFSFAACAELVISVKCFNKSLEEAAQIMKELQTDKVSSADFETKPGFNMS